MMLLYNTGIRLYLILIRIASLFSEKAKLWLRGRRGWKKNIEGRFSEDEKVIWVHCASLGEFEQGRPLIEKIKEKEPDVKILLTFFSPSGYEIRKDYEKADLVMYLPADTRNNARQFIDLVKPEAAIFIKYEFWYNYLGALQDASIPTYLVSGIFRKEQMFFRWYGLRFLKILMGFTMIFVQSEESEKLLLKYGIERVRVCGDTRFDRVYEIAKNSPALDIPGKFCGMRGAIIAGSSWPPEEDMICRYINEGGHKLKWIIAPHEIGGDHIASIESKLSVKSLRYSNASMSDLAAFDVLIIDNIGLLSSIYRYGILAVVGGGFGRGIHNVLEPASWGLPVMFGPRYSKFKEAVDLLAAGAAFSFKDYQQFSSVMSGLLTDKERLNKASGKSLAYVKQNLGASEIVVNSIL